MGLLIALCKKQLDSQFDTLFNLGLNTILADIREDLTEFHVEYDQWFSEQSIADLIPVVVKKLQDNGHLYEDKGALWFRSTEFGDDKDRVVIRDNG